MIYTSNFPTVLYLVISDIYSLRYVSHGHTSCQPQPIIHTVSHILKVTYHTPILLLSYILSSFSSLFNLILMKQSRNLRHPFRPILTKKFPLWRQRIRLIQTSVKDIRIITCIGAIFHDPTTTFGTEFSCQKCPASVIFLVFFKGALKKL